MSVGVLLAMHRGMGEAMLATVSEIFGRTPDNVRVVSADSDDTMTLARNLQEALAEVDHGDGVVILSDLYGATPCNVAVRIGREANVPVLTGANLPMLIRLLNYPDLELPAVLDKVSHAGRDAVMLIRPGFDPEGVD
ncbi:MAG: PTS fructose transporter subunit IIA [Gammaproteobacteria bacterium]|nr:PTS fructose transporter subunit IIA [Gammaproteobacteria bacterium]